ncbi:alanine racemase [Halomonas kalidii]|uniref:Alanine racemase n=1 Tax=Halomonas kalidii TaxID=3043293 RepID=A0ABT6VP60_9GAMM|nr:alanine racemase [Halomonas kalidii]MDI5935772.1 alanine racemase [Halomonas kalidii]
MPPTTIFDLPTPSLILDRAKLVRNLRRMADTARRKGVQLRPHLKTAKSIDVARLAIEGQSGGIAVSTLKEAEYFASQGIQDIQYAVCIIPDQLARVADIQRFGSRITLITDSVEVTRAICSMSRELDETFRVQVELDCGEGRSGVFPDSEELIEIARILDEASHATFSGVMTHAGHSYQCRTIAEIEEVAEAERHAAVSAAERIRRHGIACTTVSIGSTPTALYARSLEGVTEVRPGVYMFGDMFQAQINSCSVDDLAISVIAEVSSHHAAMNRLLVNAGALALSKDRSTENMPNDIGFGLVTEADGQPFKAPMKVARVYQEHGQIPLFDGISCEQLPVGTRLRIYPNHVCMTAAMYDQYHLVDSEQGDGCEIIAIWPRINGW